MNFDQPITFEPLYKERVWGGRLLADALGREIPAGAPIGESWELVDRDGGDQSIVADGPFAGRTLHELWTHHRAAIFGPRAPDAPRFPLLAKILDCRETLSVQVHPPASVAASLKGEPKSEAWFLLDATPDAKIYAGFRAGTTRESFEEALLTGNCADTMHSISVSAGDAIYIPSGRCHAIGAGCLIVEIQQNSDTTYRVFDWNRVGIDGKPRELHIAESLASIDFADHEPSLQPRTDDPLVSCEHFSIEHWQLEETRSDTSDDGVIFIVADGRVSFGAREFERGDLFLLPASCARREIAPVTAGASVLRVVAR